MKQNLFKTSSLFSCALTLLICLGFIATSCSSPYSLLTKQEYNNYDGTIYLTNGEQKTGRVGMPTPDSKSILYKGAGANTDEYIDNEKIEKIEFNLDSNRVYVVENLPVKGMFGKVSNHWLMKVAEGPNASAYIGANSYTINADGSIGLGGTRQVMNHGNSTAIVNPSFPIYMKKKDDQVLKQVALTKGISFEDSAFRAGISSFLSDDPKLTEYVREQKWGFDQIGSIVQNYIPHRGNAELIIDNIIIEPRKKSLFTADFNNELIWSLETTFPSKSMYGVQFGIGIRSTLGKFFTYSADIGYARAKYIDMEKRMENHLINDIATAPIIDEDYSKSGLFRFNLTAGGQLPFQFNKIYLIPGAHLALGGVAGSGYSTFYYGPMATFDVGFKLNKGNILLVGAGFRRNISAKKDAKQEPSYENEFQDYRPYNNLLFRLGYKF